MNDYIFQQAFDKQERQDRISNSKLATVLSMVLMPAGLTLDFFVYPQHLWLFLAVRMIASFLTGLVWLWFQFTKEKHDRIFGVMWYLIPMIAIAWMSYYADDPTSPYYAGLNIVLLAIGLLSPWTYWQNLISAMAAILIYLIASYSMTVNQPFGAVFNNLYFLILTAVIVVAGSRAAYRQRFREFSLRYELDKNRKSIEESNRNLEAFNTRLAEQNIALNQANREIKEAEAQLVQAEKMASLGRFSAGLMHDILNPLNYTKTGLFTLQKKSRNLAPEMRAEFDAVFTDIKDGVNRVQEIVQSLRNFTHPGAQAAEAVDLIASLNDARRFVSGGLRDQNISVELNIPPQQMVWIGRNDFSVMLINVLENSIDALENKFFVPPEKPTIAITSRSENDRTIVSIRDNGRGIDPKIIAKIFDPFFTTKDVGKGTGLGLSICFGMIRGYGGNITVVSELGKFSEFTLDLPATAVAAKTKSSHAEPIQP